MMSTVVTFLLVHYMDILIAVSAIIGAMILLLQAFIAFFLLIPGPQPEATLQKIVDRLQSGVDFLARFSKK